MKNILVVGTTGQIGSELTTELRKRYGNTHVVVGYIHGAKPEGKLKESGPSTVVDIVDQRIIAPAVEEYGTDTTYNLAALLSVMAESKPELAWKIGIGGLWNVPEMTRENRYAVLTPSLIGSFGESTPHMQTPQDTIQRLRTMYGTSKVTTELLSDYYFNKYGTDTRVVRFPGIVSNVTPPGDGMIDYAVDVHYSIVEGEKFIRSVPEGTLVDMVHVPGAPNVAISLMGVDPTRLVYHNTFNITSINFAPETIYAAIKKHALGLEMEYKADPLKQYIANSWPDSTDDSCAREGWSWKPAYDLESMTADILERLRTRLK